MIIIRHSLLVIAYLCGPALALASPAPVDAPKADEEKGIRTVQDAIDELARRATPDNPHPPIPSSAQGDWVTTSDYPAQALREDVEGISRFALSVSDKGEVLSCAITQTSGSALLDITTCELIRLRANFKPATNARGRPVAGIFHSSVRWIIPEDSKGPQLTDYVYSMIFEKDGNPSTCKIEKTEGLPAERAKTGPMACKTITIAPYRDKDGNPVRKLVRFRSTIEVVDAPE